MPTIKQEIKSFYLKLRREIIKRVKYQDKKGIDWQISSAGENYIEQTQNMDELLYDVGKSCDKLNIKIPLLK